MHNLAVAAIVESVRRREAQGDFPTEPKHAYEVLEDCILQLADRQPPAEESVAWLTKTKDGVWLNWSEKKPSEWITSKTHIFDVMPVYLHPAPVPVERGEETT